MPQPKTASRFPWRGLWVVVPGVIVVAVLLVAWLWQWDWFRPLVEERASAALGRKVTLQHLHVHPGWVTTVRAEGVVVANPDGFADAAPLATIDALTVKADVRAYLRRRVISLPEIDIDHPVADVRQLPDGRTNYALDVSGGSADRNPPEIGRLTITDGHADVVMPLFKSNFSLDVATRPAAAEPGLATARYPGDRLSATAHGTYAGQPVTGTFEGGAVLSLADKGNPYPVYLRIRNGRTEASLKGTIQQPLHFAGADLMLAFSGQDMSSLYPLTGVPIPKTPPFSITGHLVYAQGGFRFENFAGRVGSSDVEGTIAEKPASPRRRVTAHLTSRRVDLTDLAGFLGAQPGRASTPGQDAETRREQAQAAANPRLLPATAINVPQLKAADVDITYDGKHIINRDVPLDDLTVHLKIVDGRITADPLDFAVGTGTIASQVELDPLGRTLRTHAVADFRRVPLARLMAATHSFTGDGTIGGRLTLSATGTSMAQILGNGTGGLQLFMGQGGDISALLVDLAGLQFGDAVLSALGVPRHARVQCMIADFTLTEGIVETKALLIATAAANILGSGKIDLKDERLAMRVRTDATHFSVGSLPTPIDIGGTLKNPSVLPAAGPLGARAGAAVGLGLLFPPLALLPTIRLGLGDKNACVDTLSAIHARQH